MTQNYIFEEEKIMLIFLYCFIAGQHLEYARLPEVSMTLEVGVLRLRA